MLKSGGRLLVTLVLALVVTAVFSTLCPARGLPSLDGSVATASAGSGKSKPVEFSGDPDAPQAPPPPVNINIGGMTSSSPGGGDEAGVSVIIWWISWMWESWHRGTAP